MNLRGPALDKAKDQIERGFAAVALAAGDKPIAPFFRFPGLSDSGPTARLPAGARHRRLHRRRRLQRQLHRQPAEPHHAHTRAGRAPERRHHPVPRHQGVDRQGAADDPRRAQEARLQDRATCAQDRRSRRCRRSPPSWRRSAPRSRRKSRRSKTLVPFYEAVQLDDARHRQHSPPSPSSRPARASARTRAARRQPRARRYQIRARRPRSRRGAITSTTLASAGTSRAPGRTRSEASAAAATSP